jgi:hypothetical protein
MVENNYGNYCAASNQGGIDFILTKSKNRNLRDNQPVRIINATQSVERRDLYFATIYFAQDWDFLPERLKKKDLPGMSALILYDPYQRERGTHFLSIARNEHDVQKAISDLFFNFEAGCCDREALAKGGLGPFGKRAYSPSNFRAAAVKNDVMNKMLFVPLEYMTSMQFADGKPAGVKIDEDVLTMCLKDNYVEFE